MLNKGKGSDKIKLLTETIKIFHLIITKIKQIKTVLYLILIFPLVLLECLLMRVSPTLD
jgi:hypothetical protein